MGGLYVTAGLLLVGHHHDVRYEDLPAGLLELSVAL